MMKRLLVLSLLGGLLLGAVVSAQGSLSSQVLQLLTRVNTWTATNTFLDLRLIKGVPSDTALRFYVDSSANLYFNGGLVAGAGGVTNPHNLLSTTHADTLAGTVTRGAVVVGNATPAWAKLALCASGSYLGSNGTDTTCLTSAAGFTSLPAAQLSGTASAFDGNAITNLNATNLGTGTVPLGRLTGITNTQIAAGAAIAYSKLTLTGAVLNADLAGSIAYSKLALTGSVVTGDLTAATLLFDRWASNSCTNLQVPQYNGAAWVCKTLLATDVSGGGTVSSVALALPAIFSVSGSPVTGSGTLTATLATESANVIWAGPTTGAAATPTFRNLVVADLPTITSSQVNNSIALTGTDINTSNQVTATHLASALPMAQGGTGVAVAGDDTLLIGSGAAWVAQTLPNCVAGALNYTTATNAWSCNTTPSGHALLSAVHTDTVVGTVVRGDLIVGNTTPAWTKLAKGTTGQVLTMGVAGTDPGWGSAVIGFTSTTAGSGTLGSTALPFASLILGTAATNNLTMTPAAFAAGVVATVDDPGFTTAKVGLLKRGTIAYTAGSLSTGTCSAAVTATVTGLAATSVVTAALNAAPGTQWQKGIYFLAYPTVNTVNIVVCNPTAGSVTPDTSTFNYAAIVP